MDQLHVHQPMRSVHCVTRVTAIVMATVSVWTTLASAFLPTTAASATTTALTRVLAIRLSLQTSVQVMASV